MAASYRDRVVHHLLYRQIAPRFLKTFIANSCATIPGRGTMYAAVRLEGMVRSITQNWQRRAYYLKCDVQNFFPSINKNILHALLAEKVYEPFWLWLTETILFHDPRVDVEINATAAERALIPRHKSLFNQPAHLGLPIGNLSSQFFALVYLDVLDQHCKHDLHARRYIRYVDDFVLLDESVEWLNYARADIEAFLPARLGLQLHPKKTILQPVARGIDFVGQVVKPYHRRIRARTANDARRRLAEMPLEDIFESANSYFGMHRQATHSHRDRARLAKLLMSLGHSVDNNFTKTYRKGA